LTFPTRVHFEQRNFLLVDDSSDDLRLIEGALLKAGVTNPIITKGSGDQACEHLMRTANNSEQRPGVLMTDLKMPGMDGIDLIRWVKNQSGLEDMLVVALSGSVLDDDMARAYEAGANVFLTKPAHFLDQVKMFQRLVRWIKLSRGLTRSDDH
jgi:CheY-like chemotaxis protein